MKLICGPMATISHPAFRILVEKFGGCDEYFTEMINAGSLMCNGSFEKYYLNPFPVPEKIVWQLTGRAEENMTEAARILCELPGVGLDINMGCCAPDIYRTGAGISWMLKPIEETKSMVYSIRKVIEENNRMHPESKKRFSVKLRLGDDNFTDQSFFDFCDMLVDTGVELLTLHPRTKKEKLNRTPRYEYCQKICEKYQKNGIKIYLNGNVTDASSLNYALQKAPDVDGVMISRASVQKPWIFKQLQYEVLKNYEGKNQIGIDFIQIAEDYIRDVQEYQPQEFWKTRLQRFFTYYSQNFQFSHYAQTQFLNAKNIEDLKVRIQEFFEKCPSERFKTINLN